MQNFAENLFSELKVSIEYYFYSIKSIRVNEHLEIFLPRACLLQISLNHPSSIKQLEKIQSERPKGDVAIIGQFHWKRAKCAVSAKNIQLTT